MTKVAPIWRAAALTLPLVAAAGCDWIPVRRRLEPSLYPVPSRPEAAYLRDDRPAPGTRPDAGPANRPALAGGRAAGDLPPLPELIPVSPAEALASPGPAPTPLLDAALVRAEAVHSAVFGPDPEDAPGTEAVPDREAERLDFAPATAAGDEAQASPDGAELPAIPEAGPSDAIEGSQVSGPESGPDAIELPPIEPSSAAASAGDVPTGLEAGADPGGPPDVVGDGTDDSALPAEADGKGIPGSAEAPGDRSPPPDRVGEGDGQVRDPSLWQTVMELLAEPGTSGMPEPPPIPPAPLEPAASAFRVAGLAFCREVVGFGRIDRLDPSSFRAGKEVLVYCELEGVGHETDGVGHVSRLETTLEIRADADATPLWRQSHRVEDRCPRPRRDYFVSYRVGLPASLAPGGYRLSVSQRDLISGLEAAGDLAFSIVPAGP